MPVTEGYFHSNDSLILLQCYSATVINDGVCLIQFRDYYHYIYIYIYINIMIIEQLVKI